MATREERLVADIGSGGAFTAEEIDDIFAEAENAYSAQGEDVVYAYARVIALRRLIAATIPQTTKYHAGDSSEDRTPVLDGLRALLALYEQAFQAALTAAGSGTIRWGRLTRSRPRRDREWPGT